MSEFGDIFSDQLTATVFICGSIAFLAIYALAVTWMASRSSEGLVSLALYPAA
jgi:hypothetical protein